MILLTLNEDQHVNKLKNSRVNFLWLRSCKFLSKRTTKSKIRTTRPTFLWQRCCDNTVAKTIISIRTQRLYVAKEKWKNRIKKHDFQNGTPRPWSPDKIPKYKFILSINSSILKMVSSVTKRTSMITNNYYFWSKNYKFL